MTRLTDRAPSHLGRAVAIALPMLAAVAVAEPAAAQTALVIPQRLPEFGRSVASTDDSTALVLNPANLAFLPGSELRWTGTFLQSDVAVPFNGSAFALAFPLPFSLATGLRVDIVDPPDDDLGSDADYQWLTWGLAVRGGKSFSLGTSLERSFSRGGFGGDMASYSVGTSFRWIDQLGISLVAQNVNGPFSDDGVPLGASYTAAAAIRPFGTRVFELGVEGKYIDDAKIWVPRATLGVDIPYVGRLRGEAQVSDPGDAQERAWLASVGLSIYLNQNDGSFELGGSGVTGNAFGPAQSNNFQLAVASRGFPEPVGISFGNYAVRLRLEETPDARSHVNALRVLWSIENEPRIDAVVIELRASPGETLAHVQELRDALIELRRRGKRVLCHLEDADGSSLYLCAAANEIWINPAGGVRFAGLQARYLYFARLLEKLGIRADVIRIGEHKSAPERFTADGSSEVSKADKIDLLQQTERQLTEGLSLGRHLSFAQVRAAAKEGPFNAARAKEVGLVDGLAFDDEIDEALSKLVGRPTRLQFDDRRPPAPERFAVQPAIAIVYVEGDMIDGRSRRVPLIGATAAGSYTIAESLQMARESPLIKAVVLRIETPGGSSTAADVIWRQVQLTARVKPVIVSMGGYAASGGYYIAAPGTRIFANPSTLTGSIGVFYGKADASQLLDRIGVDVEVYKTSERADADALYRPFTEGERATLERSLRQFYDLFLERVASGRKLDKSAVDAVGQGRVWTGEQARDNELVDEIGGLRQALAYARKLTDLPEHAPIVELPRLEHGLIGRLLGIAAMDTFLLEPNAAAPSAFHGAEAPPAEAAYTPDLSRLLPGGLGDMATALAPFFIHPSHMPLMRLGYVAVEP